MTESLITYFAMLNGVVLIISVIDKACAVHQVWRIPDEFLLTLSWCGGAAGAKVAQIICGHKTLAVDYSVSLNLVVIFQFAIFAAIWAVVNTSGENDIRKGLMASFSLEGEDKDKPKKPRRFGPGS